MATQLVTAVWWLNPDRLSPSTMLEATIVHSIEALQLLFRGLKVHYKLTPLMETTIKAGKMGLACKKYPKLTLSPNTPLWGNPQKPHLGSIPNVVAWVKFNKKQ